MTRLQYAFSKSAIRRHFTLAIMLNNDVPIKGYKRLFNDIVGDVYGNTPEAHIIYLLLLALQCYDISEQEQAEVIKLLQMAEITLTTEQRQIIADKIN